jgi:stage III sporulation protein SpoIIIAA
VRRLPEESGDLLEIVLDLGREPEARFEGSEVILSPTPVSLEDIAYVADRVGAFGGDNRAGIARTLHRISAIRNRAGSSRSARSRRSRRSFSSVCSLPGKRHAGISPLS